MSTEAERRREEAQRNIQRRHDFLMRWFQVRPLAGEIPAVMNWRWHRDRLLAFVGGYVPLSEGNKSRPPKGSALLA